MYKSPSHRRYSLLTFTGAAVAVLAFIGGPLSAARAAITATGDVSPDLPWTGSTAGTIGNTSAGTLVVNGGESLSSSDAYLGYASGSNGVATVGAGSTWNCDGTLVVGYGGNATLIVTGGGTVNSGGGAVGGSGTVNVGGAGSTWNALGPGSGNVPPFSLAGAMNITGGASVFSPGSRMGGGSVVTVDGTGSTWKCWGVGGDGTLNVTNGGAVNAAYLDLSGGGTLNIASRGIVTSLYADLGTAGAINFGMGGGALATATLYYPPGAQLGQQLAGSGTISAFGIVTGGNLVFNSAASLRQTISNVTGPGQNVAVNLDMASDPNANGVLGAGYGSGSVTICNGAVVDSSNGVVGYMGSGTVTVIGPGSTWNAYMPTMGNATAITVNQGGKVSILCGGTAADGLTLNAGGLVTVDGAGSTWNAGGGPISVGGTLNVTNGGAVNAGYLDLSGGGILNIAGGGTVFASSTIPGTTGIINFGVGGGTLTTQSLYYTSAAQLGQQLTGTGVITAFGIVTDSNLLFDSAASLSQTVNFTQAGQNVTLHLDMASDPNKNGLLGAGYLGNGSLTIRNGVVVDSSGGMVGAGSVATVEGTGSTWNACYSGLGGVPPGLSLGGVMNIAGGGSVIVDGVSIGSQSLLAVDVGKGSSLAISGGGALTNNGTIRVVAGAAPVGGAQYTPISAATWDDSSGTYQAIGGTWSAGTHVFTVSNVQTGAAGTPVEIDLASIQRMLVTDPSTGKSVGASFLASATSDPMSFTATPMGAGAVSALEALLPSNQTLLSAWDFAASGGYTEGNPAYLSFDVVPKNAQDAMEVWHYDGSQWTEYPVSDLTYDGTWASFTVAGFSGYALTETVPEPSTLALFGVGVVGLTGVYARFRRRR